MKGMKTYACALGLVVFGIGMFTPWVDVTGEQLTAIMAILNGAGLGALRHAVTGEPEAAPEA